MFIFNPLLMLLICHYCSIRCILMTYNFLCVWYVYNKLVVTISELIIFVNRTFSVFILYIKGWLYLFRCILCITNIVPITGSFTLLISGLLKLTVLVLYSYFICSIYCRYVIPFPWRFFNRPPPSSYCIICLHVLFSLWISPSGKNCSATVLMPILLILYIILIPLIVFIRNN